MSRYRWRNNRTLEITVRDGERFADGTRLDADSVRHAFDEQIRWATRTEVVDDRTVRLHLPEIGGPTLGKLRATHLMSERLWRDLGFGYAQDQSGEGHW